MFVTRSSRRANYHYKRGFVTITLGNGKQFKVAARTMYDGEAVIHPKPGFHTVEDSWIVVLHGETHDPSFADVMDAMKYACEKMAQYKAMNYENDAIVGAEDCRGEA